MPLKPSHARRLLVAALVCLLAFGAASSARAADCSAASFKNAAGFALGTGSALVSADFNIDGRPDLAVTNGTPFNGATNSHTFSVYYNDGTGWFGAPRVFPAGNTPTAAAVGDLNNDGRPDLVVVNEGNNAVSILLGDNSGGFGAPASFATGNKPRALVVADFNGDGRADLAAGSYDNQNVAVLFGNGAGSLAPAPGSPFATTQNLDSLAAADFNGDSRPDLLVSTFGFGVYLMLNDGTGKLGAAATIYNGGSTATTADFNNDGKADIAAPSEAGLAVLLGNGAGGFGTPINTSLAFQFSPILAAQDFDGDGKLDLAASDSSTVLVLKGDGAGGMTLARDYVAPGGGLFTKDFDGDNKPDIVTSGSFMKNRGGMEFEAAAAVHTTPRALGVVASYPEILAFADFNNDGRIDFAATQRSVFGNGFTVRVSIMLADASGGYTSAPSLTYDTGNFFTDIKAADFNSDGKADLAIALPPGSFPPSNSVSIRLGNGDGTFGAPVNIPMSPFGSYPYSIAVGDFNNDNKPDLVAHNASSNNVLVFLGDGTGAFSFISAFNVGAFFEKLATLDFNSDGNLDVVVTDSNNARVKVLMGNGNGFLSGPFQYDAGGAARAIITGDFNHDQKTDIAVAASPTLPLGAFPDSGLVSVLINKGGVSGFEPPVTYKVPTLPSDLASADFDGDGKPDLAVVSTTEAMLSVLTNDGAGAFRPAINIPVPGQPFRVSALDLNNDNKPDLALPLFQGRAVEMLYNNFSAPLPCLSVEPLTVPEGNSGNTNAEVTVRLSTASAQIVKVNYALSPSGAAQNVDYLPGVGTLSFQPGETSKAIPVTIIGDALDELEEYFNVTLSAPTNAQLGDAAARVTIADDDSAPTLSIADASIAEGAPFTSATLTFKVTLSAPSAKTVSVNYATSDGTATSTSGNFDYSPRTGRLDFGAGTTSLDINIPINGDSTYEPDETFFVTLSSNTESTIADGQAQGTILNDDPLPSITVADVNASEPVTGSSTANFIVQLSAASSQPVTVNYATADGTASAGTDYTPASGTLTFNPGETSKPVTVTVKDDTVDEENETFTLNLSGPTGATIADGQALCTIIDNDGPAVSIGDVSAAEGQSGQTLFTFNVTLSAASPQPISLRYATAPGTATTNTSPQDFIPVTSGFFSLPAGQTSGTIIIRVFGDLLVEPDETFFVNLSNPSNCTIDDSQGQATILNDDGPGKFQFASATFNANESEPSALITVVRASGATGAATVNYTASGGTATDGSDYTSVSGTLSFAEGQTSKTFSVPLMNDIVAEPEETVNLMLSSPTGGPTLGDIPTAVLKIGDDPRPVFQFAATAQPAAEADRHVSVLVKRLGNTSTAASVKYATQDGTATERGDYNLTVGTLAFAAGETEKAIEVLLTDDAIVEGPETFSLLLSSPADSRLGDMTTIVVTIGSDDSAGAFNPIDADTEFFVRQHYADFLNREPDASGLAFWTNEIEQCGADAQCREFKRVNVSAAFFLSIEFQQTGYLVYRTYKAAYGAFPGTPLTMNLRQFMPDTQGLGQGVQVGIGDWESRLEANKRAYMSEFVKRPEFVSRYPAALTPEQFVDTLNANAGGALSKGERDQLVLNLATGAKGREEALRAVAEDADFARAESNKAFVLMQYFGYLRRNPNDAPDSDFSGYQFWLGKLNEFNGDYIRAEMVKAFLDSLEYRKRFGQ